jgi:signal transduction histidine kinase
LKTNRDRDTWNSPHPRWLRWLAEDPASGWIAMAGFLLISAFVDSAVSVLNGEASNLWDATFIASLHEWWMRAMFMLPVFLATFVWSHVISERNKRIADLRHTKERLRELNARLAQGDTQTRRDLATRLHENVGQTIGAAAMYLSAIEQDHLSEDELVALRSAARSIARVMSEVRDIAQELQPMPQDDFNLDVAVESMAERVMRRTGTSVDVECPCTGGEIAPETALIAYQVISEVVETATGGSHTSTIRIREHDEGDCAVVTIAWDGAGGDNLVSSDEWFAGVGGTVKWSATSDATQVTVRIPTVTAS